MKLFQTGSATVVSDCMNFFSLFASQSSNRYSCGQIFGKFYVYRKLYLHTVRN